MLDSLPQDPFILLSFVNTRLRDNYSSLDVMCDDLHADVDNIKSRLAAIGYVYDEKQNKFV